MRIIHSSDVCHESLEIVPCPFNRHIVNSIQHYGWRNNLNTFNFIVYIVSDRKIALRIKLKLSKVSKDPLSDDCFFFLNSPSKASYNIVIMKFPWVRIIVDLCTSGCLKRFLVESSACHLYKFITVLTKSLYIKWIKF